MAAFVIPRPSLGSTPASGCLVTHRHHPRRHDHDQCSSSCRHLLTGTSRSPKRQTFLRYTNRKENFEKCCRSSTVCDEHQERTVAHVLSKCQSIAASVVTAGLLTFFPMSHPSTLSNPIETYSETASCTFEATLNSKKQLLTISPPTSRIFGVRPAFAADDNSGSSTFMSKLNEEVPLDDNDKLMIQLRQKRSTVLDEVWTLVSKYYVDNTYNSQDWYKVRDAYESRLIIQPDGSYDDEEAMKLATAMVRSLGDKYSRILDREAYARIQKFDLIGVGATLMPDQDKRIMVGAPPIKGSEAEKAGIKYGDYIVAVNGVETAGRTAFDIIDQIAENPNADVVTMTVLTQGPNDIKGEGYKRDVVMKRQFIQVSNPVVYKISERRNDGTVVGYIRISEFNSLVKSKLEEAINNLKAEGANAFVMDLRGNPGGAFQSAVEIAGLFLDGKVATNVVDANQIEMPFLTTKGKSLLDDAVPLVIWLDGRSASASEVLAGALHDQCRAIVMGSNSFGKGLIQAVYGLKNGSGLVLTVARYVTPAGTDIQGKGITPDIEAKLPTPLIIGLSTDTSKVDFEQVATKRNSCLCPSSNAIK